MCCGKGCYSNKTKHMCSKVVGAISILLCILGIIMAAFSAAVGNSDQPLSDYYTAQDRERAEAVAGPLMIFAIIIIVISCFGLGTAKFKHPGLAIPFSISIFILGFICIIFGGLAAAGGNIAKVAIEQGLK